MPNHGAAVPYCPQLKKPGTSFMASYRHCVLSGAMGNAVVGGGGSAFCLPGQTATGGWLQGACDCCSDRLDSEAIVEFVRALCTTAQEELAPVQAPRVYSLTKIVEISHFNMTRIRYVQQSAPCCAWFVHLVWALLCMQNCCTDSNIADPLPAIASSWLCKHWQGCYGLQTPAWQQQPGTKAACTHQLRLQGIPMALPLKLTDLRAGWCGTAYGQC